MARLYIGDDQTIHINKRVNITIMPFSCFRKRFSPITITDTPELVALKLSIRELENEIKSIRNTTESRMLALKIAMVYQLTAEYRYLETLESRVNILVKHAARRL